MTDADLDEFDGFQDEPESEGGSGDGRSRTAKYEIDITPGATKKVAEFLKNRADAGNKAKGKLPLRADHEDGEPTVETFFLGDLKDDVEYVGYRRKRQMEEEDFEETETKQFAEGLGTDLWRAMIGEGGEEMQEVFGHTSEDPGGRIHAGSERNADLDDREYMVFRWRDTDKAIEQFEETFGDDDADEDEGGQDDDE